MVLEQTHSKQWDTGCFRNIVFFTLKVFNIGFRPPPWPAIGCHWLPQSGQPTAAVDCLQVDPRQECWEKYNFSGIPCSFAGSSHFLWSPQTSNLPFSSLSSSHSLSHFLSLYHLFSLSLSLSLSLPPFSLHVSSNIYLPNDPSCLSSNIYIICKWFTLIPKRRCKCN